MAGRLFTLAGAAEYKKTTYPTLNKAIEDKKLIPIEANTGLRKARPLRLLSEEQLKKWEPTRRSRLTDDQKIERAAKMLGISPAQMKAALKK